MKQLWDRVDLEKKFTLNQQEKEILSRRSSRSRLAFAILLKYFQVEGHFPEKKSNIPKLVIIYVSEQLGFFPSDFVRCCMTKNQK